jgi:hypothetical protein
VVLILLLTSIFIQFQAVRLSCLAFRSAAKFKLSVGCHVILEKDTDFSLLDCSSHTVQSYTYTSHFATLSDSTVVDAAHVYVAQSGL